MKILTGESMKVITIGLIVFLCSISLVAEDKFFLNIDDIVKVTVIFENGSFGFTETVSQNGTIFLRKVNSNEKFKFEEQQQTENTTLDIFKSFKVDTFTQENLEKALYVEYGEIYLIREVKVEVISAMNRVIFDFGDKVNFLQYREGLPYTDYLSKLTPGWNISSDSLYVRVNGEIKKKCIKDVADRMDIVLIEPDFVYVSGEVKNPRSYYYNPAIGINEYIAKAGGVTHYGSVAGIRITDKNGSTKKKSSQIEPGDIIYVPSNYLAYIRDFSVFITSFTTIFVSLIAAGLITF